MAREQIAFNPSWGKRIVGMEGLRAIAAAGVMAGHVRTHLAPSVSYGIASPVVYVLTSGLTLFFALSGFLLFRPFASALLTGGGFPRLGRYAVNRTVRIFPVYIVIFLLVSLVFGVALASPLEGGADEASESVGYLFNPGLIAINLTMLQTFFPFSMKTGLSVAWSLTVELVFYIVMPAVALAVFAVVRRHRRRPGLWAAMIPVIALAAIGVVGKTIKYFVFRDVSSDMLSFYEWGGNWHAVFARSFLTHADLFVFGMTAAVIVAAFETGRIPQTRAGQARLWSVFAAVMGVVLARVSPDIFEKTFLSVTFGAVILFVALPARGGHPGLLARVLETLPFRYVGLVSYSFYLWHVPAIWLVIRLGWEGNDSWPGFIWSLVIVFALTLVLASVTYFGVEGPALKLKKRTEAKRAAVPPKAPKAAP